MRPSGLRPRLENRYDVPAGGAVGPLPARKVQGLRGPAQILHPRTGPTGRSPLGNRQEAREIFRSLLFGTRIAPSRHGNGAHTRGGENHEEANQERHRNLGAFCRNRRARCGHGGFGRWKRQRADSADPDSVGRPASKAGSGPPAGRVLPVRRPDPPGCDAEERAYLWTR